MQSVPDFDHFQKRFSSHSNAVSSARFGDPFNEPPTMMPFDTSAAVPHYGSPSTFRAADFASRPYETAMLNRNRSHSARDYHYRGDSKDPYAGHYY